MTIKALSIKQPYADQILRGIKVIEYRSWKTNYRGPLLICAGLSLADSDPSSRTLPRGCAICVVTLTDCVQDSDGDWEWHLANVIPVRNYGIKGKLGLFNSELPDDVAALLG